MSKRVVSKYKKKKRLSEYQRTNYEYNFYSHLRQYEFLNSN